MIPTAVIIARVVSKLGYFRWSIWSEWLITILGTSLLILLDIKTSTWKCVIFLRIPGAGQGMLMATGNYTVQVVTNSQDGLSSIHTAGMCLGIAIGSMAFQNVFKNYLQQAGFPTVIAKNVEKFVHELLAYLIDFAF